MVVLQVVATKINVGIRFRDRNVHFEHVEKGECIVALRGGLQGAA